MSNIARMLLGIGFVVCALGSACAKQSSEAEETSSKNASAGAVPVARAQASEPESEGVAEAYAAVQAEARAVRQSARTYDSLMKAVPELEKLYRDFMAEYPGTEEAKDAGAQLGFIHYSLGSFDVAIRHLSQYIEEMAGQTASNVGFALYVLAECYKSTDRFEEAKAHYTEFLEGYTHLNAQLTAAATSTLNDLDTLKRLRVGNEPIPFTVKALDGSEISLEKYKGKVVLLDFWATWCGPCRVEMPNVVRIHKKYNDKGFEIIGISLDKSRSALESYIKSNDMTWPQHFDGAGWGNAIATKYRVRSVPTTFLIDREGKIRYRSLRGKALEDAVARLVAET